MELKSVVREETDPRFFLAAERTFLAWIRTGLSLMGFGFVVARFGLFLREVPQLEASSHHGGFSVGFGTTLVAIGVVMNGVAALQYGKTIDKIRRGELLNRPSKFAIFIAIALVVTGVAMAAYLLSVS